MLLERETELALLEQALEWAIDGRGGLRLIEGPPGIGKTSLLAACERVAAEQGMTCLSIRTTEIESEIAYGVPRQLLAGHLCRMEKGRRERLLSGSAAAAAAPLGFARDPSPVTDATVFNALFWLVSNLAEEAPLLLILDDLHWADRDSLRFLAFAAPRLTDLPALALGATRDVADRDRALPAATASDPATRPIVLEPLSASACADLAADSLPSQSTPDLALACREASGGNPFNLRELLDELADRAARGGVIDEGVVMSLGPRAVTRLIFARVAGLEPPAADVASGVAVLGSEATLRLSALLAEASLERAATAIDELAAAGVLESGGEPRFAHPILRNAFYAALPGARRDLLHRRAADLLATDGSPAEKVAAQLMAIRPAGDADTVARLRRAATDAVARGASSTAAGYLDRALAEPPAVGADRLEVLLELAEAELGTDGAAAREHFEQALRQIEPGPKRISVVRSLAAACLSVGELGSLAELLRDEVERAGGSGTPAAAPLEADLITTLLTGLDLASMQEGHERVERLAPELSGESATDRALLSCLAYSRLCRGVPVGEVVEPARRRFEMQPEIGPEVALGLDWLLAVGVLVRCGEIGLGEQVARDGLAAARASGSLYALAGAHWVLGTVWLAAGQLRQAVPELETGLRGARDFGAVSGFHAVLGSLVATEVECGELAVAAARLDDAGYAEGPIEAVATPGELLETRATLRFAQGDAEGALEDYDRVESYARMRGDLGPGMTTWRAGAALARHGIDDDRAARLALEELERARRFGAAPALGFALVVAGRVIGGDDGLGLLEEAVDLLEGSPFKLRQAQSLVELGSALRRSGHRARAREPLREGLALARACGATPLAERAFQELQVAGARSRKVVRVGFDALTPSEERIARRAAAGLSNREIAQELFVNPPDGRVPPAPGLRQARHLLASRAPGAPAGRDGALRPERRHDGMPVTMPVADPGVNASPAGEHERHDRSFAFSRPRLGPKLAHLHGGSVGGGRYGVCRRSVARGDHGRRLDRRCPRR